MIAFITPPAPSYLKRGERNGGISRVSPPNVLPAESIGTGYVLTWIAIRIRYQIA